MIVLNPWNTYTISVHARRTKERLEKQHMIFLNRIISHRDKPEPVEFSTMVE